MTSSNKPVAVVRDGSIKASVWRNPSDRQPGGHFYSIRFTRTYKDAAGQFQDSDRFSDTEALRLARVAGKVYDKVVALRDDDRAARRGGEAEVEVDYDDSEDSGRGFGL